jgi:hypothetical protein
VVKGQIENGKALPARICARCVQSPRRQIVVASFAPEPRTED